MWVVANQDVSIGIEFTAGSEFIIPDTDSVKVTVRDNLGVALPAFSNLPVDVNSTTLPLSIPAIHNSIEAGREFENRYVVVSYAHQGTTFYKNASYRIVPFIPMTAGGDDVRRLVGANAQEIPDTDIDLYQAYFDLYNSDPALATLMAPALVSGTYKASAMNEAIAIRAALTLVPTLPQRMAQSEKSEVGSQFVRSKIDINAINSELSRKLAEKLAIVTQVAETTRNFFGVSTPTDVVTG